MEEKIENIIKNDLGLKTIKIEEIKEGFSHNKFLITTDGVPKEIILRFENTSLSDKEKGLGAEKFVIEKMAEKSLPVPKIYSFNNSSKNLEEQYMIIEKLNGTRLDTIWENLSKEDKVKITKEIGKLLSAIHKIKLHKFGVIKAGGKIHSDVSTFKFKNNFKKETYHSKYIRQLIGNFSEDLGRLLSYKERKELPEKLMRYLMENIETLDYKGEPTLLHGDFHKDHIFVDKADSKWRITGIIDFEFASSLAPEYDMLKLHRQGFFDDPDLMKAFEEGYGKFDIKAIEISRTLRDIGLGCVWLDSGDPEVGLKILKDVEDRIDKSLNSNHKK